MQAPPTPPDEPARLHALRECALLDTPPEARFDRLTRLTQRLFGTPMALISLVDENRQWFKSVQGLDVCETARDVSFCGHTILGTEIFNVPDARLDRRFADNPFVSGPPYVRFYAGAPLSAKNGHRIGTLCVIDDKPRHLTQQDLAALRDLADCVEAEINQFELKQQQQALHHSENRFRILAENAPVGIFETDTNGDCLFVNEHWCALSGLTPDQAAGQGWVAALHPADREAVFAEWYNCANANLPFNMDYRFRTPQGKVRWLNGRSIAMRDAAGDVTGYLGTLTDITERKQSEQKLAHAHDLLERSNEAARIGTWEVDMKNLRPYWSKVTKQIHEVADDYQCTLDEAFQFFKEGEHREAARRAFAAEVEDGEHFDMEHVIITAKGNERWVRATGTSVFLNGRCIRAYGTFQDISERKLAEQKLAHAYDLLERSNTAARIGTWEVDLQTMQPQWSKVTKQIHEVPDDYVCRLEKAMDFFKAENRSVITTVFSAAVETGKPYDVELRIITAKGHERWVRAIGTAEFVDGKCRRVYGTFQDISERKHAEEALKDSEFRWKFAIEGAGDGLCDWDLTRDTAFYSKRWKEMLGFAEHEIGEEIDEWRKRLHPDEKAQVLAVVKAYLDGEIPTYSFEHRMHCKDGNWIWVLSRGMIVNRSENGKPLRMIGTITDITERKRVERLKSEFISTVSHELRTPLTSISGALGLASSGTLGTLPEQAQHMIDIAQKNSQRLTLLVNDLLDMEKLEAGKLRFDMRPQLLMPIIEQAIEGNRSYGAGHNVTLTLVGALPNATVQVDSHRLQQAFSNLLSNAIKFSPENGTVEINVEALDQSVRISVIDHGPGIPIEFHHRLFHKFAQADASDTRKKGGTGLGLAITRNLIEHMGGEMGFESEPGHGARFFFSLPLLHMLHPSITTAS